MFEDGLDVTYYTALKAYEVIVLIVFFFFFKYFTGHGIIMTFYLFYLNIIQVAIALRVLV